MGKRFKSRRERAVELDKVVRQAFIKDGDLIEKEIERDNEYEPDEQDAQELYQRIMTRIEAEEAAKKASEAKMASTTKYRGIPTEALEREEFHQQYRRKRRRRKKVVKWVAVVAATLVGVFGVTMTSQANRMYFMDTVNYLVGNRVNINVNSEAVQEDSAIHENEVRDKVLNETGIQMPRFQYVPANMTYMEYSIDKQMKIANVNYSIGEEVVNLLMQALNSDTSNNTSVHGKNVKSVEIALYGIKILVWEVQDPDDLKPSFVAKWEYNNCSYQLSGKLNENDFLKILEQIGY